jgi:hypothetical protein
MSENGFERDETSSTRFKKAASQWWLEQNINVYLRKSYSKFQNETILAKWYAKFRTFFVPLLGDYSEYSYSRVGYPVFFLAIRDMNIYIIDMLCIPLCQYGFILEFRITFA